MFDIDVQLQRATDAVAHGDFNATEPFGVQLNPDAAIARQAIPVAGFPNQYFLPSNAIGTDEAVSAISPGKKLLLESFSQC